MLPVFPLRLLLLFISLLLRFFLSTIVLLFRLDATKLADAIDLAGVQVDKQVDPQSSPTILADFKVLIAIVVQHGILTVV